MKNLIPIINEIIKYGFQNNVIENDKEKALEKNLINIYSLYFEIKFDFDEAEYTDFEDLDYNEIRKNVESNFKDFGFYKMILNINDIDNLKDCGLGDAIDDLSDVIIDLTEIKWRIENNSLEDGLWFFEFIFRSHTQQHIIDLLNFMKQKNE